MSSNADIIKSPIAETPSFKIKALSNLMAAEVIGLDLSKPFDHKTKHTIHKAFLDHQLLVFRNQNLNKEEQVKFTQQFGDLERHAISNKGSADSPFVHIVTNLDANGIPTGTVGSQHWHSDKSFRPEPSMATILHAKQLPPKGGDTWFANMYGAYSALEESQKSAIEKLSIIHILFLGRPLTHEELDDAPPMAHPLVRIHPETGRKCLFLGMHASHIDGISGTAGKSKVRELESHATEDRFIFRHKWEVGDLLMWDNRCLLHRADANFDAALHPRVMHRTCLKGTPTA